MRGGISCIVEQLGFATIPSCQARSSGFTCETTSGMSGSIRQALELSMTVQPRFAASGASSFDVPPPALKSAMSIPSNASGVASSTVMSPQPGTATVLPAERSDASRRRVVIGNRFSRRTCVMVRPTAPVAPTTATVSVEGALPGTFCLPSASWFGIGPSIPAGPPAAGSPGLDGPAPRRTMDPRANMLRMAASHRTRVAAPPGGVPRTDPALPGRSALDRHLLHMNAQGRADPTTTAELLALARSGDRQAFTELVDRHHAELVRIAYAVTGDLDAARDSAQLAWIKAWQRLPSVREPERLRAWLIAIAANEARQHLRAHRRRRVREIVPPPLEDRRGARHRAPPRIASTSGLRSPGSTPPTAS